MKKLTAWPDFSTFIGWEESIALAKLRKTDYYAFIAEVDKYRTSNPAFYANVQKEIAAHTLGSSKSPKKAASGRENGTQGGRPRGKSIINTLNAGADPVDLGFDCRADDGQGNEYWCKNQGAVIVRLNCYTDPETDKKYWDDDVSGWENQ